MIVQIVPIVPVVSKNFQTVRTIIWKRYSDGRDDHMETLLRQSQMAAENTKLNTLLFIEEVQKYPAIYNKFSTDYKNKFIRMNIWKAIGEKFGLDAAEAEKKI